MSAVGTIAEALYLHQLWWFRKPFLHGNLLLHGSINGLVKRAICRVSAILVERGAVLH